MRWLTGLALLALVGCGDGGPTPVVVTDVESTTESAAYPLTVEVESAREDLEQVNGLSAAKLNRDGLAACQAARRPVVVLDGGQTDAVDFDQDVPDLDSRQLGGATGGDVDDAESIVVLLDRNTDASIRVALVLVQLCSQ